MWSEGACWTHGKHKNWYTTLVGGPLMRGQYGEVGAQLWIILRSNAETSSEDVKHKELARDGAQWRGFVPTVAATRTHCLCLDWHTPITYLRKIRYCTMDACKPQFNETTIKPQTGMSDIKKLQQRHKHTCIYSLRKSGIYTPSLYIMVIIHIK
jgi:hypothetical protein